MRTVTIAGMKRMLVLTRLVKEYEPRRLAEEGRKMGYEVDLVKYGQIAMSVTNGSYKLQVTSYKQIGDYDLMVPRAASKKGSSMVGVKTAVLEMARRKKEVRVLNGESFALFPLMGKLEQGLVLAQAGLPTVDLVSFGSKKGWREFKEKPTINFPLVIKGRFGSHGRAVKLVNDWEQFDRVMKEYKSGEVLVQPKLRVRQWYRAIVIGEKYLGEMRHRQKGKYGGEGGRLVKFNSTKMMRLKEICLAACKLFAVDYAGLDVAWDEDKQDWVIWEINRTAQFKYFEKRTGVNVAMEIISYLGK